MDLTELGPARLSEHGAARRDAMRVALQRTVVTRRRVRKTVRGGIAALVVGALGFVGWTAFDGDARRVDRGKAPVPVTHAFVDLRILHDDADVVSRYRMDTPELSPDVFIRGDTELLQHLRDAGHDTGIMRIGSRVVLTNALGE